MMRALGSNDLHSSLLLKCRWKCKHFDLVGNDGNLLDPNVVKIPFDSVNDWTWNKVKQFETCECHRRTDRTMQIK